MIINNDYDDDDDDDNNNNNNVKLDNRHWYDHLPKSVKMSHEGKVTILPYYVRNDRTIPNNKEDTIISDNKQGTCMLIDAAIPGDRTVIKNEAKKI